MTVQDDLATVANNLAIRMMEIEKDQVTKSAYRELAEGEQDESPTGDTYNLLWDAILDEFHAVGVDISSMIRAYKIR